MILQILPLIIILEIILTCFIFYGFMNEKKLIDFENRIFSELTKKIKNIRIEKK